MKGNEELVKALNSLLDGEFTVINEHIVQSEICAKSGSDKLAQDIRKRAMDEMIHAGWLIERIAFIEGESTISRLNSIKVDKKVSERFINNENIEPGIFSRYNESIKRIGQTDDQGSLDLSTRFHIAEEEYVNWSAKKEA
jgi:bacterioferritin